MRKNHRVHDPGEVQDSMAAMPGKTPVSGGALSTDRFLPLTLILGLATIFLCETLLLIDVWSRGWVVMPDGELSPPSGLLPTLAHWFAVNTTPISWVGVLGFPVFALEC